MNFNPKQLKQVALALAALVSLGPIAIHVNETLFTLQTLIICLVSYLAGWRGVVAVILYIGLGLVGLPVWSNYHIEPDILTSYSAGFVLGFIPMSVFIVIARNKMKSFYNQGNMFILAHVLLIALAVCFNTLLGKGTASFPDLVMKFIPGIAIKSFLATLTTWALPKMNIFHKNPDEKQ